MRIITYNPGRTCKNWHVGVFTAVVALATRAYRMVGKGRRDRRKQVKMFAFGFLLCYLLMFHNASNPQGKTPKVPSRTQSQSTQNFFSALGKGQWNANYAFFNKVDWVDKGCRTWAQDGDIDVDQTCLVVKNVSGSVSIIPNPHSDAWLAEISTEMAKPTQDKWIKRFLEVRGW